MLGALGAAVTAIFSQYLDTMLDTFMKDAYDVVGRRTDVVRLGARVVSGVGFLGTGTIIVTGRQEVKGLTTAAGLWASACMGLAVGAGFYECVLISFLLIVLSLNVLPLIENTILTKSLNMLIYLETDDIEKLSGIINFIKREEITLYEVEISKDQLEHLSNVSALLTVRLPMRMHHAELMAALSTLDGVITIDEV